MCLPPVWPTLVLLTAFGVRVPEAFSSHAVLSVSVRAGHVRFRRLRVACFRGAATCPVASLGAPGCETGGGSVLSIGRRPGGTRNGFKLARPGGAHSVLVACGSPRSFPERHVGPLATPGGFGHPERHTRSATSEGRGTPESPVPNPDFSFGPCATWRAVRRRRAGLRKQVEVSNPGLGGRRLRRAKPTPKFLVWPGPLPKSGLPQPRMRGGASLSAAARRE